MLTRCFAVDLARSGVRAISMHPGWVSTDMGGPNAPVSPEQSVQGMIKVIANVTEADNGEFFDFTGKKVDW